MGMYRGGLLQSNSSSIQTVKCQGEMRGMDEPVPWQQKQRGSSMAKTPRATVPALFLDFPYHQ